jgi:hypothetical protein
MRCLKGFVIVQILRCVTIIRKGLLPFFFLQNSTGNICALVLFLTKTGERAPSAENPRFQRLEA